MSTILLLDGLWYVMPKITVPYATLNETEEVDPNRKGVKMAQTCEILPTIARIMSEDNEAPHIRCVERYLWTIIISKLL
jgi:hypothetical protein